MSLSRHTWVAAVDLEWSTQGLSSSTGSKSLFVRFSDSTGRWGRWATSVRAPLAGSTKLITHGAAFDVWYGGTVPARNVRFQVYLADRTHGPMVMDQSLGISPL